MSNVHFLAPGTSINTKRLFQKLLLLLLLLFWSQTVMFEQVIGIFSVHSFLRNMRISVACLFNNNNNNNNQA